MKKLLYIILFVPVALFGQDDYSLSFDGVDDYVDFNSEIIFGNPNQLTKSFWIKTANNSPTGGILLTKRHEAWFADWHTLTLIDGHIIFSEDCAHTNDGTDTTSTTFIADNNWHYIVAVKDLNNYFIYVDGILAASSTINNGCTDWSNLNLNLGYHGGWSGAGHHTYFEGLVDDVCIWDTALTQQDIQQYMTCPPTGTESGLVAFS